MNKRQRKKTLKKFCQEYGVKPPYFNVVTRRYKESKRLLERELDQLMDYYYGKFY